MAIKGFFLFCTKGFLLFCTMGFLLFGAGSRATMA
jgi:hypothetical protein